MLVYWRIMIPLAMKKEPIRQAVQGESPARCSVRKYLQLAQNASLEEAHGPLESTATWQFFCPTYRYLPVLTGLNRKSLVFLQVSQVSVGISSTLVGGLEHEFYFPTYWEYSSQVIFIFSEGVAQPPTSTDFWGILHCQLGLPEAVP